MVYQYKNHIPVIHESAFIHPQSAVTGNVTIGKNVYVGPGAALRGDFGKIIIENGCNVQENCTIHMFPGVTVLLKENAHIGHGAIIHGATIGKNCMIGMNSVIMDNVILEDECIVGALSFVKADQHIPVRSLLIGNPAKIIKEISDERIEWKTEGTKLYQELTEAMKNEWKVCEPLRQAISENENDKFHYKTWNETRRRR
jgi:carbonic anhydrase/acetyltransferase-like protein (isoleucine patch superfamily)